MSLGISGEREGQSEVRLRVEQGEGRGRLRQVRKSGWWGGMDPLQACERGRAKVLHPPATQDWVSIDLHKRKI